MVEIQSLTSTDRYKVHRSRVKPYLDDPRNFPPEVIAARDYSESIVFDVLEHRFIDGNLAKTSQTGYGTPGYPPIYFCDSHQ